MTYFTRRRYKKKCIQGYVNIPYGTILDSDNNGLLYFNMKPVCYNKSQDAFDYFVGNQDGQGEQRAKLVDWILEHTKKGISKDRYEQIWEMIWNNDLYQNLRRKDHPDRWLWYVEFYSAPISLLEKLKEDIQGIEKGRYV